MTIKVNSVKARQTSEAMKIYHAAKRETVERYRAALEKIYRQPTSTKRSKTIAAKALNGHLK